MSSYLRVLDPGIRQCGVALFKDGVLVAAGLAKNTVAGNRAEACKGMASAVSAWFAWHSDSDVTSTDVAVEWPQIYASRIKAGQTEGDPNDLIALAAVSALVASAGSVSSSYLPAEWKGQLKKPKKKGDVNAMAVRCAAKLSPVEQAVVSSLATEGLSKDHNTWDAVGIGLFHLGRLHKRVIAY